ncbi:hypothetical protein PMAYCL1PPCAC_01995, partial [Pristionchus mayeri]
SSDESGTKIEWTSQVQISLLDSRETRVRSLFLFHSIRSHRFSIREIRLTEGGTNGERRVCFRLKRDFIREDLIVQDSEDL